MIHAYDEEYVALAQRVLGDAVDFAVGTLGVDADMFGKAFLVSDSSNQVAHGNPKYVAGMNGCELARKVLTETGVPFKDKDDVMYIDKSPEFWAGWALAFYQWYSGKSFSEILRVVPLGKIINMYTPYHEMDIMSFVDRMQETIEVSRSKTKLRMKREYCGISQSELARRSGVPLRQIQLFEQRQRDINKAAAETLLRLSRSLYCGMEDLIEN